MSDFDAVVALAERAGRDIMRIYADAKRSGHADLKSDLSPVTLADRVSHDVIVESLTSLCPGIPVLSEEGSVGLGPADERWIVDPLDGTKEFLKRSSEFTVNIALVRGDTPLLGVVHAPALGVTWLGEMGRGATRIERGFRQALSPIKKASGAEIRIVVSKDHAGPRVRRLLEKHPKAQTLSIGSSLKFCLVAEGRADLYLRDGPTMEWDTAAAHAVLRAAGGEVFTLDGQPLRYGKADHRNPEFVAVGDPALDWRALVG